MVSKIRPNSNRALSCEESEIRDTAFISKCLFSLILTKKIPPPYADETLESRLPRGWDTDLEFLSIRDIRGGESKKGNTKLWRWFCLGFIHIWNDFLKLCVTVKCFICWVTLPSTSFSKTTGRFEIWLGIIYHILSS